MIEHKIKVGSLVEVNADAVIQGTQESLLGWKIKGIVCQYINDNAIRVIIKNRIIEFALEELRLALKP